MTKFVKGLSGRPIANDQTSDSDLGVDALRNDMGHGSLDSPAPTVGIGTPADDVGSPGFEVGISVPAGDYTSSGDVGGGSVGLGAWESIPEIMTIAECGCAACQGLREAKGGGDGGSDAANQQGGDTPNSSNPETGPIGELLTLGTNPDGSHFFSGNRNVDATLIGSKWSTLNLTYSFPTSGSNYNGIGFDAQGVSNYHVDLGTQQQAAARAALAQISAATGMTFTEITDTDSVHANIRISQTADQDVPSAFGNFPSDTKGLAGDIWFGRNNQPFYDMAFKGTWGFSTMMHEIGHTMGLKHGHQDYTNSDLSGFLGTSPRFGSQSLTPDRDGQAWSLMTYSPAPFVGQPFAGDKISQPQTYMQYDLAALQYLYGANFNTNSGDSVYTFSQTTGEMFINGVGQGAPSGNRIFLTIWDGGGNDTIDASNYANGVTIDLRPGEFSTVDQAQLVNNLAFQNVGVAMAPGNFAMSLLYNNDVRSLIENATGGTGNDIFIGNTANNVLDGGAGSDSVIFTNPTGVNLTLNDTNTDVIVTHDGETDTLRSIENIGGTSGNDTITGNSLDNLLTGGSGGTDVLNGGGGADRLVGGGFTTTTTFSAPSQPDITKPQSTNNNSIATAVATAGFFDVDANPDITNATSMPHATINAVAFGGGVEYYRIDVTVAGSQAIFDIDGGGTLDDSIIELINSGGTVLASNDTGNGDVTFPGHDDAYLTFTFTSVGTYYIRVGRFISNSIAQPMLAGQSYQLNISLQNAAVVTTTVTANNTSSLVANGGEGNDVVVGTLGNDTLTGGNGNDTVSFVNAFNSASNGLSTTGVTVDLTQQQGAAQNTVAAGNDTLLGFENVIGSALNDTITGDANDNVIEGGLGNDTLVGGNGNDTASYAGATAGVTVSLALQGVGQNAVNAGTDTLSGFENLLGSGFNDSLTGDANANVLSGGAGDDTLNPGANAGGTVDLLDGGIGSDTASFAGVASGVTATLNGASDVTASIVGGAIATLRSIENLTGSSNGDTLTGDANANVIEGGLGDDTLDGGLGVDTVAFTGSIAVTLNLATLTAQATGWGSDTITNFENVRTGSGADNITGDGNDNTFFDGGGADTYNGAGATDTVDYTNIAGALTVNLNLAGAQAASTGGDILSNIENVTGSLNGTNTLTGNTSANRLTGGSAGDTIVGNNGADVIFGGAGNDFLLGGTSAALDDASADTLEGGLGNDYLSGGLGNDILRGGDGDDTLVGTIGATTGGFFANDGGDDTYDGGDGTDIAIMAYENRLGVGASTVGISFDLRSLAGDSAITFNGANVGSLTSIERVTFRGTSVDDDVHGSGFVDSLTGNSGNDVLDGWIGNDTLSGGLGNDILMGGDGLDMVTYVNSTAGVNVDLRIEGVAQNTGGEGIDTLSGLEYLTGSAFGDNLRGTDDFNLIIDTGVGVGATALSQTDSLFGFAGNDSILVTRGTPAAAVATNVNMDGGDGDDFIELRGGTLSVGLATNVSGLINQTYLALGATSNDRNLDVVTVDGGAGNDRIILTGVASATVNAGSGADIVSISMRGATSVNNYQLTLGSGADIIQLGVGSNAANSTDVAVTARTNRVTDFQVGNAGDKFEMSSFLNLGLTGYTANSNAFADFHLRLVQSGTDLLVQTDRDGAGATNVFVTVFAISNGYTGGFTAFNFDGFIGNLTLTGFATDETITGATGDDVLSGGDGNDVLNGLGGTDTLDGGNGDDTLNGGTGADTLIGGAGNDNLNGDAGVDRATYAGNAADYAIVYEFDGDGNIIGFLSVTDNNIGNGDESHDTLTSVEQLSFANGVLNAGQAVHLFNGATLIGTFDTIQAAIDAAADGNTIRAAAGTYAENLNVNKDVTILGANDGVPGDGTRGAETVIDGQVVIATTGVTVDGVSIVGDAASVLGSTALVINAGSNNFSLVNSVLSSNSAADFAIFTAAGITGLDIGHNLIEGYSIGAYVSGGTTAGSIHDNLFQGDGGPITGLGNGVNSETSHVLIQNNIFDGLYSGVLNLFPFGPNPVDLDSYVIGNTLTGNAAPRPVQIYPTAASTNIVGTDYNEAFNGDIAGLASGTALTFDGQGGDDHIYGFDAGDTLLGGDGNDRIFAQGGNDNLTGGLGSDLIYGEAGTDTAHFAGTLSYVDTVIGWAISSTVDGNDFLDGVEVAVDGDGQRNLLVGSTAYATLQAALTAAQTDDNVRLASGTYTGTVNYSVDGLTVIAQPGAVQNLTYATASGFGITIMAAGGADTITTGDGNDVVFGGGGNDVLNGGAGSDTLIGDAGTDTLSGGAGNDFFRVEQAGDIVLEGIGGGSDQVYAVVSYTLGAGSEVELLASIDPASTAAMDLTGNEFAQTIIGNAGANTLIGGGGNDIMAGGLGNDFYRIEDAGDIILEGVGGGADAAYVALALSGYTLNAGAEVELLSAIDPSSTAAFDLNGNEFGQTLIGTAGANTLIGGGGNDVLAGGLGNDVYRVEDAGDVVLEYAGGGADAVYAVGSYTLQDGYAIEVLSAIDPNATGGINLTGNDQSNTIFGNAGANTIDGKGGGDTLVGGGGADLFAFTTALGGGNADAIFDFVVGTDKIGLDDAIFTGIGGTLDGTEFVVGGAATTADHRIIYESATGALFYDADGNGLGAAVLFATVDPGLALTASDFQMI
jgi:Ca2+-binding RTX toxin-like protein